MSRTFSNGYGRQQRAAGRGYTGRSVVFILLCCALAVFLLSTSYLGDKLVDEYITPVFAKIMGKSMTPEPSGIPAMTQGKDPLPTVTPAVDKIVFDLPETSWYLLQMGAYADPEEAHAQALSIQSMGAGGYIYEDEQGFSRVFAAAYADQESLLQVQQQVRNSGFDNTAYSIHPDGVQVTLSGVSTDAQRLKTAMETIQKIPRKLTDFALEYDEEQWTPAQAIRFLNDLSVSLSAARQCFEGLTDTKSLSEMDEYASWIMDSISTFLAKSDTMTKIECGAAIKHFQIESILKYNILIKDIE
jgi:hypothetical protein